MHQWRPHGVCVASETRCPEWGRYDRLAEVPGLVSKLLADRERLARMRDAMLRLARPNAAAEIAEELIALCS